MSKQIRNIGTLFCFVPLCVYMSFTWRNSFLLCSSLHVCHFLGINARSISSESERICQSHVVIVPLFLFLVLALLYYSYMIWAVEQPNCKLVHH